MTDRAMLFNNLDMIPDTDCPQLTDAWELIYLRK